jgi:hypothetical protein
MNTLASKIAKASAEVGGRLKADKKNTNDNYLYISADKILAECGQALAAQGIAVIPSMTNAEIVQGQTAGGKNRYDGRISFVMTVTDGETEQTYPWYGFGADYTTPDKAIYKAITSGHKYFLSKLLMIGEGNEDGEHEPSPDVQRQPAKQAATNNGNGHADNPFEDEAPATPRIERNVATEKQHKMLFALGKQLYADNWDTKRAELVRAVTGGRSESAGDLTVKEMSTLLDGLKKRADDKAAIGDVTLANVPEMAH